MEQTTKGGIYIPDDVQTKEQLGQVKGVVLDIGADAWKEFVEPWAKVGDTVLYQRYAGMKVPDGKGGFRDDILVINDLDITAVVEED